MNNKDKKKKNNILPKVSLILGILAVFSAVIILCVVGMYGSQDRQLPQSLIIEVYDLLLICAPGFFFGIPAVACGIISLKKTSYDNSTSIIGIVLGSLVITYAIFNGGLQWQNVSKYFS